MKTKILFFPFGNYSTPSTRARMLEFSKELKKHGFETKVLGNMKWKGIFNNVLKVLQAFVLIPFYDILYFNKSAHSLTYPLLRWAKFCHKKVVSDVDDCDHLRNPWQTRFFKECDLVVAGSSFLKKAALKHNKNVVKIPTPIRVEDYSGQKLHSPLLSILWMGTEFNYFMPLMTMIADLQKTFLFCFSVIVPPEWCSLVEKYMHSYGVKCFSVQPWWPEWQQSVKYFDIGIMPLGDNDWDKGKCGLKALEYMAAGVPVVASCVGENKCIVPEECLVEPTGIDMQFLEHGKHGKRSNAGETKQWCAILTRLLKSPLKRRLLAKKGFKIVKKYDVSVVTKKLAKKLMKMRRNKK